MDALLGREHICRLICNDYPELQAILQQIMLDITTEENRDTVGPTILAVKHVLDTFALFKARGEDLLAKEAREDRTKQNNARRP